MKEDKIKSFVLSGILVLSLSCTPKPEEDISVVEEPKVTLPEMFSYQGRNPDIWEPESLELMIKWNQNRTDLNHKVGHLLADTVTLHLSDGRNLVFDKSGAEEFLLDEYNSIVSQKVTINAAIPVYYDDIDHAWIYSWIFWESENSDGIYQSVYYHEDLRIIDNKIREIFQFRRASGVD